MATGKLPVPAQMDTRSDPRVNWKFFEAQWNNYEVATGLDKKEQNIRVATLLSVMGKECFQIYQHLTLSEAQRQKVEDIIKALREHFEPKTNVIYERYMFNTADQQHNETVDMYIARLRALSDSCDYGALQTVMIRDRLVLGTKDNGARSRMLREPDLTLEKAMDMCRASEIAEQQMKRLGSESVNFTKKQNPDRKKKQQTAQSKHHTAEIKKNCKYCGSKHAPKSCPAYGKTCKKCNKKNHFAKVCLQESKPHKQKVHVVEEDSDSEESLFSVSSLNDKQLFADVTMNLHNHEAVVKCQIDTGASCNVISIDVLNSLCKKSRPALKTTKTKLKLYDGGFMVPKGKCLIECSVGNNTETLEFFVVDLENKSPTLLSAAASMKLGILTVNIVNSVSPITEKITKEKILSKYSDVFSGLGCLPGEYKIELQDNVTPVQHSPRKIPISQKEEVKQEIDRLVKKKVITKVTEPTDWISSMVVVRKPNKLRICLDPKDLNKAVKRPKYMIPNIEDVLPKVAKAKVFTVLDAKDGFWQVKLDEQSSKLTTFWTPFGRYRWLRLPFGISSAPEEFQRRQHEVLEGLPGIEVIADDILIYGQGETMEEAVKDHEKLVKVLDRARAVGLKLNKDKMKLRQTEVTYMGHVLTSEGVKPDMKKVQAVVEMPKPIDVKGVQRFLGLVTYLSKFMPNLSSETEPLRRLTEKNTVWHWESQQEQAFDAIKRLVTEQPVLRYYDITEEVTIQCDASESGLGATLLQKGQPVAFASRALTTAEKHYAQIEKECLAIVFACERFDQYIYGRSEVTVLTDHKPLEMIYKKPLLSAPKRLQRMLLRLQKYSLDIQYMQGKDMYIADTLSRAYLQETKVKEEAFEVFFTEEEKFIEELELINFAESVNVTEQRMQQIKQHTMHDEALQTVKSTVLTGWPDTRTEVPLNIREYWNIRDEIAVQDGVVYKGTKVIIPKTLRKEILTRIHSSHMGIESCVRKAKDVLYWPNMRAEVKEFIEKCSICAEYSNQQQKETLMTHEVPDRPWSKLGVDIFTWKKVDYLITVDYYSDFWELDELNSTASSQIILCLKKHFSRHGIPDTVVSDNGPQFVSAEFNSFATDWEFEHVTSSPYHSQSNGKAESAVKIAKRIVKKAAASQQDIWKTILDWRNTPTEAMNSSPVQRLMSRRTRHILPIAKELLQPKVVENVQKGLLLKRQKSKQHYDKGAKDLPELKIGQPVRMAPLPNNHDKRWRRGTCVEQHSPRSYIIEVDGQLYRRNRKYIRPTAEDVVVTPCASAKLNSETPNVKKSSEFRLSDEIKVSEKSISNEKVPVPSDKCHKSLVNSEVPTMPSLVSPKTNHQPSGVVIPRRSTRIIKPPKKLDDYV